MPPDQKFLLRLPLENILQKGFTAPLQAQTITLSPRAGVAELVDAPDSKSGSGNRVGVRFPPRHHQISFTANASCNQTQSRRRWPLSRELRLCTRERLSRDGLVLDCCSCRAGAD